MSLTDRTEADAIAIADKLRKAGIRAESDVRSEKIGYKIRAAQLDKIPYMLIIGDKEKEAGVVAVRSRKDGDLGTMSYGDFLAKVLAEDAEKVIW